MRCGNAVGRRGFAIFISIGVLALLSVLASSFAIMAQMERSVASSYVDRVRAKLLATAGIEMAVGRLARQAKSQGFDDLTGAWAYRDGPGVDLESSVTPSYQEAGVPVRSGQLAATYDGGNDYYVVKILDCASMLDLNGPQANLANILENLGRGIADLRGTNPIPAGMGARITAERSSMGGRFRAKTDLLRTPIGMTQAQFDLLRDYVTVECYRDPQVILPNPNSGFPGNWPNQNQLLGNMNPARARAPINLNTAPYPLLVAWAAGLQGWAIVTTPTSTPRLGTEPIQFDKAQTAAITYAEAQGIANQVIARRQVRPFRSMDDVAMFIDCPLPVGNARNPYPNGLVQLGSIPRNKGQVLLAMADPNLTTNKLFPTNPAYNPVDKQDLNFATFEVCFSSMGFYEIESLGRVIAQNNVLRGDVRIRTVSRVYRVLRQTAQRELLGGISSAQLSNVNSYPENMQDFPNACPFEGLLGLSTEWQTSGPGGTQIGYSRWRNRLGWDSGGAGMRTQQPLKDEDDSVFRGSDVVPDGIYTLRQGPEDLTYVTGTNWSVGEGAMDFWVKLSTAPTVGSDECLMYIINTGSRQGGGNNAQSTGECVKLERFGTMLRCTRFFWGYPAPEVSPYWHLYVEREALIDNWQPNEWHHIALQWKEYTRPTNDEWQEYDYWSEGRPYFWDGMSGSNETTVYGAPDVNLYFFIDGQPVTRLFTRYSQNRTYIVDNPPEATTLQRRVRLGSKTPPPRAQGNNNYPTGTIDIGGYEYQNPQDVIIYRQYLLRQGRVRRFANCTIDDLNVYSTESFNKAGFAPPERFRVTGGAYTQHAVDLRSTAANSVLGTIRWNQRLPWAWRDRWLWPTPGQDQTPYVGCTWGVGNTLTSTANTTMAACEGTPIGMPRGPADRLTYRLDFYNPGGLFPLDASPVVEDVILTVVESPAFLCWETF